MFEGLHLFCEGVGRIVGRDGAFFLEDGGAVIVFFVDEVDGDTAFGVSCGDNGFVDEVAVHAFAAVFGQEGGVDVDDFVGESLDEVSGYFPEEAGEDDEVDAEVLHQFNIIICPEEGFFIYDIGGYVFVGGDFEDAGVWFVGNDGCHLDGGVAFEVIDDLFGV